MKGSGNTEEGGLIESEGGVRCENALEGFLEEEIAGNWRSSTGEGMRVVEHSKHKPRRR